MMKKVWIRCFGSESKDESDIFTISSESEDSANEGMPVIIQPKKRQRLTKNENAVKREIEDDSDTDLPLVPRVLAPLINPPKMEVTEETVNRNVKENVVKREIEDNSDTDLPLVPRVLASLINPLKKEVTEETVNRNVNENAVKREIEDDSDTDLPLVPRVLAPLINPPKMEEIVNRNVKDEIIIIEDANENPDDMVFCTDIDRSSLSRARQIVDLTDEDEDLIEANQTTSDHIHYYRNDEFLPIYGHSKSKQLSSKDIANVLLTLEYTSPIIARTIPTSVENNCTFIVDTKTIGNWKNLLADDNGAWTVNGRKLWYVEFDGTVCNITRDKEPGSDFQLIRHFYRNDSSKDFHRVIVVLQSLRDKTIHTLCLVQYYFDNEEHSIEVKPHGNSKTPKSYMRTQDSVKDRIRGLIPFQSPKEVVHTVLESIGGTEKIKSCGEKVRDRTQVKNFKRKSEDSTDDIFLVTEMYNEEKQEPSKAFIRKLTVTPEFTVALATDQQLLDIERFCTDPRQFSILGVDTTFNVGTYYITMTTYRHLQLLTKQKTHPVMIGPVLLHQQRKRSSYIQLPSSMLELRPALRNILAIGTDGEKNLYDAFVSLNPNMTHLLCDIHMRDNIKSKLCALDFSQDARTKILNDIFGRNVGEAKVKGLIDTETDTEFETMLNDVIEEWEQIQPSDKIGQFVKYFKDNKVQQIQSSMTADVRSRCGLGYPPAPFTQNANECMNKVLKQRGVGEPARLTVKDFICKLKTLVNRQDEEAFLAMLGQGEKTLAPEYQYLQVQESRYYRMTSVQKQATRKKFFCSGVDTSSAVGQRESSNASHADEASLTVKPEESGITSVPFEMFRSMFTKAAMMKTSGEDIMKAPGRDHNNYMVTSSSTNVPHLVAVDDSKGSFICDKNCAQFSSVKICAHVLSVADHVGQLPSFLTHFKKTSMKKNLTTLANFGLPSDRGKKASKSTQKRKGPVRPVVATYMDRPKQPAKKPKHPDPLPNSYELTLLNFCNAQVQKCYGCAGTLKLDGGTIPEPPQNMAVVTKLQREYYKDGRKQQSATFTNAYFHLSVSCIKRHNQYFVVELVHVSDELKPHLTVEHMSILKAMGIMC